MRRLLVLLFLFTQILFCQVKLCSWNLCDMGKSKTPQSLDFMAQTVSAYNLVALQEIIPSPAGAKAVAELVAILNRSGTKWDYCISDPTSGTKQKSERYAFLWKTSEVSRKKAWLDQKYATEIEREPYMATFVYRKKEFTLVNFHAITKKLQPETEIKYFKFFGQQYPQLNLIFAGDFNCPQSHSIFNPLKKNGYAAAFSNTKTTLKQVCKKGCTASEFDNFFYPKQFIDVAKSGIIPFYISFEDLKEARKISDHLPIWMEFEVK